MSAPAARVGDMTGHGTPLGPGPGALSVLIGGRPAWRAHSDVHVCPLTTGGQPHVGGMAMEGSGTVFIEGQPAARAGDAIVEPGGPNAVVTGAVTVLIG
jgi:uncharacterized Zn-binding protein involved in type VI secretion